MTTRNMELQTKRLILRPWQESDAEALYKYAQNPNVGPIAGWPPHTSVENSREIIKLVLSGSETYAVVLKATGEAVGSVGIMMGQSHIHSAPIAENECEIGYWIGEPYWGQGLIPEAVNELLRYAFDELHQTAVWCGYYEGNEKSKRVQEKCGFIYSHTETEKPVPLLNDVRTEHFTKLTLEAWRQKNSLAKKIFHALSHLQYLFLLIAFYLLFKPIFKGFDYLSANPEHLFSTYSNALVFFGVALSFSALQDPMRTTNGLEKIVWQNPKYEKVLISVTLFTTFLFFVSGLLGFVMSSSSQREFASGSIILAIGLLGYLKFQIEVFEMHKNKMSVK